MSETILDEALERFEESQEESAFNREAAEADIRFARLGDQWPDKIKKQRELEGRPCLTINKLPAFIRQVVNDSRQNKPAVKVSPVDNGADVETAEVISGLIKSIERGSNAEIAYDTGIDHAVSGGFGFFRISTDYCHADTFDMEARIERVPNPLMVHWDVSSTQFDASDWDYAFVSDLLTEEQFKLRYPKADAVNFEGDTRDATSYWLDDDKVRVAEYFLRTEIKRNLLMFEGPQGPLVIREDQLPGAAKQFFAAGGMDTEVPEDELVRYFIQANGYEETRRREVRDHEVIRRIISGVEVLEEHKWPGTTIPICPVWGEEVYMDGKRHFRSMVRDAKDPQSMFNFWRSSTTELVALAPKAPWLVEKGAIPKGEEAKWETANNRSYAYLEYAKGSQVPQRQPFAGVPAGAIQESLSASDDIKAIIGIYDSSLGARSNETSGRAIMARQRESDVSNFHFIDNLSRAIRYAGRVLVEIIPSVYNQRSTVRILGDDMKEKVIKLKSGTPEGDERLYDLSVGKYDVTVSTGPSFATQREETRETLIEIMSRVPDAGPYIGDVLLEHMDFAGADKVAKRLKSLLPPAVQKAEAEESKIPPEVQGVISQLETQNQQLQAQLQEKQSETQAEMEKAKADILIQRQKAREAARIKRREANLEQRIKIRNANTDIFVKKITARAQARIKAKESKSDEQL